MNHSNAPSVTVVVPTFNRGEALRATLNALLASASSGFAFIEILVVDDGSPTPAAPLVDSIAAAPPFSLRCIRQPNRGPGSARNTGFRQARGRIVLFVDDDIVVPVSLLQQHSGAHLTHPHSVIYGISNLLRPALPTPLHHFICSLCGAPPNASPGAELVVMEVPASGHISVEREMFDPAAAVYSDNLSTPAAEEFELAYRLQKSGIPLLLAPGIIARHDQPVDFRSICQQQYKHALGAAEVIAKYPSTKSLPPLDRTMQANLEPAHGFPFPRFKRSVLRFLALAPVRKTAVRMVEAIHFVMQTRSLDLRLVYWAIVSAHYHAGLRDGSRREWS